VRRLRERLRGGSAKRMSKRKAALALSAGVMGLGTAAMPVPPPTALHAAPTLSVPAEKRKRARFLKASPELLEAMIEEEGARERVYRDVAGYPTVGVGHLVKPEDGLQVGDRISKDQVLDFLEQDIAIAERAVVRLAGDLPLLQNEFDALVDLVFNVGEGNVSAERSPRLNAAIAAADYDGIAAELDYHHARGRIAKGLVYRSERRSNIFMDASYEDPRQTAGGGSVV
jgi:GH24 family phage-related lysozyme (muramidase)